MNYYPKSQITTNLYTSGGEYVRKDNNENYMGHYWTDSSGNYYSGKTPTDKPTIVLIPKTTAQLPRTSGGTNETDVLETNSTSWTVVTKYSREGIPGRLPQRSTPTPTEEDYELGEYQRYYTKKRNQNSYFEISQEDYTLLTQQNSKIQYQLYLPISLSWVISGNLKEVEKTNKSTVALTERRLRLPGFTQYFKDNFTQYHKFDITENLETDGTEYKNKRTGQPYKGFYHLHPEKGPMVGATHVDYPHDFLIPIDEKSVQDKPKSAVTGSQQPTITYARPTVVGGGSGGGSVGGGGGGY